MAHPGPTSGTNRQLPAGVGSLAGFKPKHPPDAGSKVEVVDPIVYTGPTQPTPADLMKAIQDLSSRLSQLSKNQQAIETRLRSMAKQLDAIDANTVAGAVWLSHWAYCIVMNMPLDGPSLFWPQGMKEPHWK